MKTVPIPVPKFNTLNDRLLWLKGRLRLSVEDYEVLRQHVCEAIHEAESQSLQSISNTNQGARR